MFERFTDRARRVVVLAQEEARDLGHNFIGTEHLLLGLIREGEGVAARVLEHLGVGLDVARAAVVARVVAGGGAPGGHIPFTPRAKKVLELSLREAFQLGHDYIGTEHILLGLLREGQGMAAGVLSGLGVTLADARQQVVEVLGGSPAGGAAAEPLEAPPVADPTCPWCRIPLVGHIGTKALAATRDDEGGVRPVVVLYCQGCGRQLGVLPR